MIHWLEVCGVRVSLEFRALTAEESDDEDRLHPPFGKSWPDERKIVVTPKTPEDLRDEVVAHEVMHVVLCVTGLADVLGDTNEEAVAVAAEALWRALRGQQAWQASKVGGKRARPRRRGRT